MAIPYSDMSGFKPYMSHGGEMLRKLLLRNGFEFRCSSCGIMEWMGVAAPLQVDHINGDRSNCMKSNVRFLCPNCHALTDTFSGRNRALSPDKKFTEDGVVNAHAALVAVGTTPTVNAISVQMGMRVRNAYEKARIISVCSENGLSISVRPAPGSTNATRSKIAWPSPEDLLGLLETMPRTEVAGMLGVSDVAVKKHCLRHGIQEPKSYRLSEGAVRKRAQARKDKAAADRKVRAADTRRSSKLRKLQELHGTESGYRLELRLGLPTCAKCRAANVEVSKRRA